jgi:hypothetical protein
MKGTMIWIAAAALIATPAAAQNEPADANATTVTTDNAVAANDAAAMNDMAAGPATDINAEMAPPAEEAAPAPAPAPVKERGFPWGVIGLVGLVGLLGRRRGD